MQQRDTKIDNIKGGLMILVIFGHMIEPLIKTNPTLSNVYDFIYLFHIPAFVFLSGCLVGDAPVVKWNSLIKGIVIPFLMFSFLYEIPDLLINKTMSGYIGALTPNWILWFLVSLLCWRLITPIVMRFRFALLVSIAASLLISLTSVDGYTYGAFRTVILFPFYLVGVLLCPLAYKVRDYRLHRYLTMAAMVLFIVVAFIPLPFNRYFLYCVAPFNAFGYTNEMGLIQRVEYYPIALFVTLLFCLSVAEFKILGVIGRNSLYVYLWHGLIVKYYFWPLILEKMPATEKALGLGILVSLTLGYLLSSKYVVSVTNTITGFIYRLLIRKDVPV
ncbi:MAG TPA: acyltransferase family protein [Scandinavium sp.]|jgi:fucose 4-O-acetylase-like acetyltransferase